VTEHEEKANAWVSAWVDKHVKTRILDGRPHPTMIAQLKRDVAELIASCVPDQPAPRRKKESA
jgi:hypothetical protein